MMSADSDSQFASPVGVQQRDGVQCADGGGETNAPVTENRNEPALAPRRLLDGML